MTGSSVQFLSTGNIQFGLQPSPVDPAVGGAYPGSAAGQYGLLALSPGVIGGPGPGGTGLIAARDLVADATSGVIPLIGNTFDASQIVGAFVTGSLDVNLLVAGNPYVGTVSTVGSANNELAGGTLTSAGGIDTLTIPIYVESPVTVSGVTVLEAISGQMVATAAVPEPSSITLACVAVAGLVGEALRVADDAMGGAIRNRGLRTVGAGHAAFPVVPTCSRPVRPYGLTGLFLLQSSFGCVAIRFLTCPENGPIDDISPPRGGKVIRAIISSPFAAAFCLSLVFCPTMLGFRAFGANRILHCICPVSGARY